MEKHFKLNLPKTTILIVGLLAIASLSFSPNGSFSIMEILSGKAQNEYPLSQFQMVYWIYIVSFIIAVVTALLDRYDIAAVSSIITLITILVFLFNDLDFDFVNFIASIIVAFLANAELIEVKRKTKKDN